MAFTCNFWSRSLLKLFFFLLFTYFLFPSCMLCSVCSMIFLCDALLFCLMSDFQRLKLESENKTGILRGGMNQREMDLFVCTWRECFVALFSSSCRLWRVYCVMLFSCFLAVCYLLLLTPFFFLFACFCYED